MTELGDLTWPDLGTRAAATVVVIPVGSTEQHGPHLPLSTDTQVAVAVARRLAAHRTDMVVAPAVPYGSSGEHAGFAGTLSIGQKALELMLVELIRSADAFAGVLILSAHGGNAGPVRRAVEQLRYEGRRLRAWSPPAVDPADSHAGRTETSLLLAVHPAAVRAEQIQPGVHQSLDQLWPVLRRAGVAAVSPNGVLGDPTDASAAAGEDLLSEWTGELLQSLAGWP